MWVGVSLFMVWHAINTNISDKPNVAVIEKPLTTAEIRINDIEKQFSMWSGAHRGLEKMVEKSLNDPDSYEHIETRYTDMGDHIWLNMKYRARNQFGGMVTGQVIAKSDINGNVFEIISSK